jgi:hypothetical protein
MVKKGLVAVSGLVLLLGLLFGRDVCSYVSTTAGYVNDTVRENVPISFELERARGMIADLGPEIGKHKREIAREELELQKLQKHVSEDSGQLAKDWGVIERMRDDLGSKDGPFVYASGTYSYGEVETDLSNKFDRYETQEQTLKNRERILTARQKSLTAAREKLKALIASKRQLEVEVEQLEARMKMVEVAKAISDLNIDDSQLSRTRELLTDIEARIEVDAQMVNASDIVVDEIVIEDDSEAASILDRITNYEAKKSQSETYVDTNKAD